MRVIAFAVPAFVACGFFLYVLIQFRRDEKLPRKGEGLEPVGSSMTSAGQAEKFAKMPGATVTPIATRRKSAPRDTPPRRIA